MYGTIARFHVKPGAETALQEMVEEDASQISGFVASYTYRTDDDPNVVYVAIMFESKAAYTANAQSPEQHQRYLRLRELMAAEPEWHDGEIIHSITAS